VFHRLVTVASRGLRLVRLEETMHAGRQSYGARAFGFLVHENSLAHRQAPMFDFHTNVLRPIILH